MNIDTYDPLNTRLRPYEAPFVYYGPCGFLATLIVAFITSYVIDSIDLRVLTYIFGGFGSFMCLITLDRYYFSQKRDRRAEIIESRPTRLKKLRVVAVPQGEHVVIHTYERTSSRFSPARHDYARFHAENEADKAHEFVEEARSRVYATIEDTSTPDARVLAKVINKSSVSRT